MTAYVIVDISILDPVGYEKYKQLAPASIASYGGKYLARGGPNQILEGDWMPARLVILEFPDAQQAKSWLNSEEYAPARELRHRYASTNMVLVEGV
jgi:uncharacterized protein (DUF1330 family)